MTDHCLKFSGATIHCINIYRGAPEHGEKFIDGIQAKLTPSQKEALRKICIEHGMDMSTLARDAITAYIDLFPYKDKIDRHRRLLRHVLDGLT